MIAVRRGIPVPESVEELRQLVRDVATRSADEAVELGWRARQQEDPDGRLAPATRFEEDPLDASVDALVFVGMHLMKLGMAAADAMRGEVDDPYVESEAELERLQERGRRMRTDPALSLEGLRQHVTTEDVEALQRLHIVGRGQFGLAYHLVMLTDCSKEAAEAFLKELGFEVTEDSARNPVTAVDHG